MNSREPVVAAGRWAAFALLAALAAGCNSIPQVVAEKEKQECKVPTS
jgi:hypothetical protein